MTTDNLRKFPNKKTVTDFRNELLTPHNDYTEHLPDWNVCDIIFGGERAFLESGMLKGCMDFNFENPAIVEQSLRILGNFSAPFNALKLTLTVYKALLFMKSPSLLAWKEAKEFLENKLFTDVDGNGTFMGKFVETVTEEVLLHNRAAVVVDYPHEPEKVDKVDSSGLSPISPIMKMYKCKDILSWNYVKDIYGRDVLLYVVLRENSFTNSQKGFFKLSKQTTHVVYILEGDNFSLQQYIDRDESSLVKPPNPRGVVVDDSFHAVKYEFFEIEGEKDVEFGTELCRYYTRQELSANKKELTRIPVFFAGGDNTAKVTDPLFLDLAYLNKSYNMTRAKLGFSLYFVASPVPYIAGANIENMLPSLTKRRGEKKSNEFNPKDMYHIHEYYDAHNIAETMLFNNVTKDPNYAPYSVPYPESNSTKCNSKETPSIVLLPNNLLLIKEENAKLAWMTYDGEGLQLLADQLDTISKQMTILGARILNEQKKDAVAAETANIERIGENAGITSYASTISKAITNALLLALKYEGIEGTDEEQYDFSYRMNVETLPQTIEPDVLRSLNESIGMLTVSRKHVIQYLIRVGFYTEDVTEEEIIKAIEEEETMVAKVTEIKMEAAASAMQSNMDRVAEGEEPIGVSKGESKPKPKSSSKKGSKKEVSPTPNAGEGDTAKDE